MKLGKLGGYRIGVGPIHLIRTSKADMALQDIALLDGCATSDAANNIPIETARRIVGLLGISKRRAAEIIPNGNCLLSQAHETVQLSTGKIINPPDVIAPRGEQIVFTVVRNVNHPIRTWLSERFPRLAKIFHKNA